MKAGTALLLSIRPQFAEQIFAGTKTVELRRIRPRVKAGDLVIVYASGSEKALVGAFQVADVFASKPNTIWRRFGSRTGLTRAEFDDYYAGVEVGYAIEVAHTWRLLSAIKLAQLRRRRGGFHPPQGYRYLNLGEVFSMGGEVLMGAKDAKKARRSFSRPSPGFGR